MFTGAPILPEACSDGAGAGSRGRPRQPCDSAHGATCALGLAADACKLDFRNTLVCVAKVHLSASHQSSKAAGVLTVHRVRFPTGGVRL